MFPVKVHKSKNVTLDDEDDDDDDDDEYLYETFL
jgi:hypothetical protein